MPGTSLPALAQLPSRRACLRTVALQPTSPLQTHRLKNRLDFSIKFIQTSQYILMAAFQLGQNFRIKATRSRVNLH
jgi:hypothetical protein